MATTNWQILHHLTSTDPLARLEEIKQALFASRLGTNTLDTYLNPSRPTPESLIPLLPDLNQSSLTRAVKLIKTAIAKKQPLLVYGDYDADGVCATAILWETLHTLGGNALPFIPHRQDHGYGLSIAGLTDALKLFPITPLIITVDNGITAVAAAKYLKKKKIPLIITDHHEPPTPLPLASAIIHSTHLSGSGLSWLLSSKLSKDPLPLDLAALGTVCDLLPLDAVNRPLVKYGLIDLRQTTRLGLLALFNLIGVNPGATLTTYHLGFIIGPRLNASGRLASALDSLRLLCTKNQPQAQKLAATLDATNQERQTLTATLTKQAINSFIGSDLPNLLIVDSPDYHQGLIGLIASRLSQYFHRPALAISVGPDIAKGSARSIPGIDITSLLSEFKDLFTSLGGHHQAAGFSLDPKTLPTLKDKLISRFNQLNANLFAKSLIIDIALEPQDLNFDLLNLISTLSPFGVANPEPVFSISLTPSSVSSLGKTGEHLKFTFDSLLEIDGLLFNTKKSAPDFPSHPINFAFQLKDNNFRGQTKLQLMIKDIQV